MKKLYSYLTCVYYSPRHLIIHVLFLITIAFLSMEKQHEDALYKNIIRVNRTYSPVGSDTAYIRNLMQTINTMMYSRLAVFNNTEQLSIKNRLFNSVDTDLMYGHGACGGFSKVLARSLQLSGYKVRIGQMRVNGVYGGHIIVEVYLKEHKHFAVIDPLFLVTFPSKKDSSTWAGFEEVRTNWAAYSNQLPPEYDPAYNYSDIRYANWEKIPVVGKLVYKCLQGVLGKEKARGISIRPYLLNMYATWLWLIVPAYFLFCIFSFKRFTKKSKPAVAT